MPLGGDTEMGDFEQLLDFAMENAETEKEIAFINAIKKRGWMGADEERKLMQMADR